MTYVVFKPTAAAKHGMDRLAVRPKTFEGKTVGIFWNAKVNADVYLARIQELIAQKYPTARFITHRKPTATRAMRPEDVDALRSCDAVVNAFGD